MVTAKQVLKNSGTLLATMAILAKCKPIQNPGNCGPFSGRCFPPGPAMPTESGYLEQMAGQLQAYAHQALDYVANNPIVHDAAQYVVSHANVAITTYTPMVQAGLEQLTNVF